MGDDSKSSIKSSEGKKECPVCFNEFSINDYRLKLLSCTHEVCIGCVQRIDKCPICQENLNVVDLEGTDFISRRGFSCFTCKQRRTSAKMRICIGCSENKGFLVKPEKLKECSDFIFCSECIIEDHIEQGHRQEKLINYDHEYITIKQMQRTCLIMKPIFEKINSGLEERADRYRNLTKIMGLVLSPDVDVHFADFYSACTTLEKCLNAVNEEAEMDRKFATVWDDLRRSFDEKTREQIQQENAVCLKQKEDSEATIHTLQDEIDVLQLKLNEKIEEHNKERQKWKDENERLAEEFSKRNEMIVSGEAKKHELLEKIEEFLEHQEAAELRKEQELFEQVVKYPVQVSRFSENTGDWTITPTSIHRICISTTKPMYLCGLYVFGSSAQTCAKFTIRLTGPNNVDTSVQIPAWNRQSTWLSVVNLGVPVKMIPGSKYVLDMTVDEQIYTGCGYRGTNRARLPGHSLLEHMVEFSNCEGSETTVEQGIIDKFLFAPC